MNIQSIRRIDYWIGIPICFLLSVLYTIGLWCGAFRKPLAAPQKILFLLISELGSTVVAYPAFRKVQEKYENAEYFFLIFRENKDVVSFLGLMPESNIITLRKKNVAAFFEGHPSSFAPDAKRTDRYSH